MKFRIKIPKKVNEKMKKLYEDLSKLEDPIEENHNNV